MVQTTLFIIIPLHGCPLAACTTRTSTYVKSKGREALKEVLGLLAMAAANTVTDAV